MDTISQQKIYKELPNLTIRKSRTLTQTQLQEKHAKTKPKTVSGRKPSKGQENIPSESSVLQENLVRTQNE